MTASQPCSLRSAHAALRSAPAGLRSANAALLKQWLSKKSSLGNRRSRQRGSTVTSELLETVQHELRVEKEKELCAWGRGLDWRPWEAVTPASVECGVFSLDL